MFIAMVDNDVYTEIVAKKKHSLASQVGIYLSGEVPGQPPKLNFTDNQ